jgi:hypothetical protein
MRAEMEEAMARKQPSAVQLDYWLETQMRRAAWTPLDRKPNGKLDDATFYWPEDIRSKFDEICRATAMLRRYECGCSNDQKLERMCQETYRIAAAALKAVSIKSSRRKRIALVVSMSAHAPRADAIGPADDPE